MVHLILQPLNGRDLFLQIISRLRLLLLSLGNQLLVPSLLLFINFFLMLMMLLSFTLINKVEMGHENLMILGRLFPILFLFNFFLNLLLVELFLHESCAITLTLGCLLLFLVVKQGIEL